MPTRSWSTEQLVIQFKVPALVQAMPGTRSIEAIRQQVCERPLAPLSRAKLGVVFSAAMHLAQQTQDVLSPVWVVSCQPFLEQRPHLEG